MSILSGHQEQTAAPVGTGHPVLPRVNLLPPEIGEAVRFRRIQMGLGGGLLATLGVVALLYVGAVSSVGEAETELAASTATGTQLQAENAKYADVTAVYAAAAAAEARTSSSEAAESADCRDNHSETWASYVAVSANAATARSRRSRAVVPPAASDASTRG